MKKIELEIAGSVPIGGHRPGEKFSVPCDSKGVPTDIFWRRRLLDEERYNIGAVIRAKKAAPPAKAPVPATPEKEADK